MNFYDILLAKILSGGGKGGAGVPRKDVNFLDYDGTVAAAYTKAEFLALSAMPANPSHEGLTAQGWNWSWENARSYVSKYGRCEIGQMYITDDGKTRLYISIPSDTPSNRMFMAVSFSQSIENGVTVDWGDGSTPETVSGTTSVTARHTYENTGNYVITLDPADGCTLEFNAHVIGYFGTGAAAGTVYSNRLKRVEIGRAVTKIGDSNQTSTTSPRGFTDCGSLASVTIPKGVTSIEGFAFYLCYSLTSVTIPDSVTSIGGGYGAFRSCYALASATIPDSVTSLGNNAFSGCYGLRYIEIPESVTSIGGSVFAYCKPLASVTIPEGVTSIEDHAFEQCCAMDSVTIPDSVTSIGSYAFAACNSVGAYHIKPITPPTLSSTNAFQSIKKDCIIYVPYSEDHSILEAYKNATNWASFASKMQEEPQS